MEPLPALSPLPLCGSSSCQRPCDVWLEAAAYEACNGVEMTMDGGWATSTFRNSNFFSMKNWFNLEYIDENTEWEDLSENEIFDMAVNSTSQWILLIFLSFLWIVICICFCCGTCQQGCTRSCCESRPRVKPFQLVKNSRLRRGFWISVIFLPIMTTLCCLAAWLNDSFSLSAQQYQCALLGSSHLLTNGTNEEEESWGGLNQLTVAVRDLYEFYAPANGTIAGVSRNSTDDFVDSTVEEIETILADGEALVPLGITPTQENFKTPNEDGSMLLHQCLICEAIDQWLDWNKAASNLNQTIEDLRELQDDIYDGTDEDSDLNEISIVLESLYSVLNDPSGPISTLYTMMEGFESVIYYVEPLYFQGFVVVILIFPFLAVVGGWLLFGGTVHHYKKPSEPNTKHAETAFCCLWCFFALAGASALFFMTLGFLFGHLTSSFCEPLDETFSTGKEFSFPGNFTDLGMEDVNMTGLFEQCLWKEANGNLVAVGIGGQEVWDEMVEANDNATIEFQNQMEETRVSLQFDNLDLLQKLKYNTWVYFPNWEEAIQVLPNSIFAYKQAIYGGVFPTGYDFPQFVKDEFSDDIEAQLIRVDRHMAANIEKLGLDEGIVRGEQILSVNDWDTLFGFESIAERLNSAAIDAAAICPDLDIKMFWCACGYQLEGSTACDADVQFGSVVDIDVNWPEEDFTLFPAAQLIYQCFMAQFRATLENIYLTQALYFGSTLFWAVQKCQINRQRNDDSDLFVINGAPGTLEEFSPYSEIESDPGEWGFTRTKLENLMTSFEPILPELDIYEDRMMQILPNLTSTIQERLIDDFHCRSLYHMLDASVGYICYQFTGNALYLAIVYSLLVLCCLFGWIVAWKWYHYWRDRNSPANDLPEGFHLGGGLLEEKETELNQSFDSEMFT